MQEAREQFGEENRKEQFNRPRVVVDIAEHRRKREALSEKKEMEISRGEIERIKGKIRSAYEKNEWGDKSRFFIGAELLSVDPSKLTEKDLSIFKKVKDFEKGKIEPEKAEILLTDYCDDVRRHEDFLKENSPEVYIIGDSRIHFLAWIRNRMSHSILRKRREQKKKEMLQ